jgi:hypothetical protein
MQWLGSAPLTYSRFGSFELDLYESKFLDARIDDVVLDAQVVTASARRVQRRVSQPAAQRDHHQPRRSEA